MVVDIKWTLYTYLISWFFFKVFVSYHFAWSEVILKENEKLLSLGKLLFTSKI